MLGHGPLLLRGLCPVHVLGGGGRTAASNTHNETLLHHHTKYFHIKKIKKIKNATVYTYSAVRDPPACTLVSQASRIFPRVRMRAVISGRRKGRKNTSGHSRQVFWSSWNVIIAIVTPMSHDMILISARRPYLRMYVRT